MSDRRFSVQAIVSMVDRISGPMRRMTNAMRGPRRAFGNLATAAGRLRNQIGLIGAAGLGAGFGMHRFMSGVSDLGVQAEQAAKRLQVSTEWLSAWQQVGRQFGIDPGDLADGMRELAMRADEFVMTGGGPAAEAFERLGLSIEDLRKTGGDTDKLFELIVDNIRDMENTAAQARVVDELFGGQAGERFPEMLSASQSEMEAFQQAAVDSGRVIDEETGEVLRSYGRSMTGLMQSFEGLRIAIGTSLVPVLMPLIEQLTDWIQANRDLIATKVETFVERLATWLQEVDWSAVLEGLQTFADRVGAAVDFIGGWDNALIGLIAVLNGPLIAALVSVGAAVVKLGVLLLANPIGLAVAGIALAVLAIYNNWGGIGDWFEKRLGNLEKIFSGTFEWIIGLLTGDFSRSAEGVKEVMRGMDGVFKSTWEAVAGIVSGAWDEIRPILDDLGLLDPIMEAWEGLKKSFDSVLGTIEGLFEDAWNLIEPIVDSMKDAADLPGRIGKGLSNFGSSLKFWEDDEDEAAQARQAPGAQGYQQGSILREAQRRWGGQLDVRFHNAPDGMRVESTSDEDMDVKADTGIHPLASGAAP